MRRAKQNARPKPKVKHYTPTERMALRRHKRKFGPAALRRKEARKHLQPKPPVTEIVDLDPKTGEMTLVKTVDPHVSGEE
jgi:hypothetical protein